MRQQRNKRIKDNSLRLNIIEEVVEMEKVSVCIPTYNRATTIERTIKSILSQTYCDLEIYICDNASTDKTKEIVEKIDDPRIHYLYFDKFLDVNYSFIRALQQADTEYICLFHSDDYYYPDIISNQLDYLKRTDVGAVFSQVHKCDDIDALETIYHNGSKDIDIYDYKRYLNSALSVATPIFRCPTFMTKKSVLLECGLLSKTEGMISDMSFWMCIVKHYKIVALKEMNMNYYISNDQLSKKIYSNGYHNGHLVIAPSFILLDKELELCKDSEHMISKESLLKYSRHRINELIRVNETRKKLNYKPYNYDDYIIRNNPFTIENVATNEQEYLRLLYKK